LPRMVEWLREFLGGFDA